jgi:hypothetical protein
MVFEWGLLQQLEQIINEKWQRAMNSVRTLDDWRRTGYPTLVLPKCSSLLLCLDLCLQSEIDLNPEMLKKQT